LDNRSEDQIVYIEGTGANVLVVAPSDLLLICSVLDVSLISEVLDLVKLGG